MSSLQKQALAYVETRVQEITKRTKAGSLPKGKEPLEERIMGILCSREFNHLSKAQQREQNGNLLIAAQKKISDWVKEGAPLSFYLDLGGGYHAAIDPTNLNALTFTPGLGELLVLSQIKSFRDKVSAF
ncbi:hypothetical protein KJ780_03735, partial [Candidatus Micrarchaeota archaeon]|nr:hypothetical protein [Candidatus Micrarchaeota archaeon]